MPRRMFDDIVEPSAKVENRRWYTVPLSIVFHTALVGAVVIVPLLASEVLPALPGTTMFVMTAAPPPPPPPPQVLPAATVRQQSPQNAAPVEAPRAIAPEAPVDPRALAAPVETAPTGLLSGAGVGLVELAPAAPPVQTPPPAPTVPVRVGSGVKPPTKIKNVDPVYPAIAQTARVQGTVIIEATIGADGRVADARILRSVPLLDQAALDAVKQWQYTPTLLDGQPTAVIMTVTVTFALR